MNIIFVEPSELTYMLNPSGLLTHSATLVI
jgi:hypothetical protein